MVKDLDEPGRLLRQNLGRIWRDLIGPVAGPRGTWGGWQGELLLCQLLMPYRRRPSRCSRKPVRDVEGHVGGVVVASTVGTAVAAGASGATTAAAATGAVGAGTVGSAVVAGASGATAAVAATGAVGAAGAIGATSAGAATGAVGAGPVGASVSMRGKAVKFGSGRLRQGKRTYRQIDIKTLHILTLPACFHPCMHAVLP